MDLRECEGALGKLTLSTRFTTPELTISRASARQECKLNAVTDMVRCFADVVDAAVGAPPGEGPDPVQLIVGLYQAKAAGAH